MRFHKKGMGIAGKIIASVIGAVVGFAILNALLPTFITSTTELNTTMADNGIAGYGLLKILPFLLVIGVVVAVVYALMHKKGWG
jgi:riboflavin transporter FmnP